MFAVPTVGVQPVPLVQLAPKRVADCERSPVLRAACPRLVPRVRALYLSHLADELAGSRPRSGLMRLVRDRPVSFGRVRLSGLSGDLILAPSYPRGGMLGNHLVFRWGSKRRYVVSLHAWEPLLEAEATLRAIVASTPAARHR